MALALLALATLAYLGAACSRRAAVSGWRIVAALTGAALLGVALSPGFSAWAHHDFRGHMAQHLLVGMLAPLALVLSAPVSLALRVLPVSVARRLTRLLRSRWIRTVSHPLIALILNIGGMYLLYLTPLYALMLDSAPLHALIHFHFLVAGYLFCWSILAGPDPTPNPPGVRLRMAVLFVSIAAHAVLGKIMYGYLWPRGTPHSAEQLRQGAELMYYGGDFAELLLAVALFATGYGVSAADRRFRASIGTICPLQPTPRRPS